MRRLAQQTRDDQYSSQRDYQDLHTAQGQSFHVVNGAGEHCLTFRADIDDMGNTSYVGVGAYLQPSKPVRATVTLKAGGEEGVAEFELGAGHWNRAGLAIDAPDADDLEVTICWQGDVDLAIWGLSAGSLELPQSLIDDGTEVTELNKSHLAPETYYLIHEGVLDLDVSEEESATFEVQPGAEIVLKKCSYCGRVLPVDPKRLGTLAFHKHNAKKSKHQNECRACKKWRINDDFNPKRTVDQLHESSVITRERSLFLRDPQRLQSYKRRTGEGLKSRIWKKFGRKCFYCGRKLALEDVHLDHTRPLAYLWPIDEHATCLCPEHNNQKKDKFPVDFYNETQLRELAEISGLSYDELVKKEVNDEELQRIRADIVTFAQEWEARTFAATARKVIERRPDVDLYADLKAASEEAYDELMIRLAERPLGVEDGEE